MAKVTSWGFTRLRGKVKEAEFRERKNKVIELSKKRVPSNPRTDAQKTIRNAYGKCVEKWNKLSYDEKLSWRTIGNSLKMSGYNAFMRQCISGMIGAIWYELTIDNTGNSNTLTDYQVLLNVSGDAAFFEDCENNQVYLEFYDEDQETLLKHWVEEWDTTNHNARIWIKVPSIPGSGTKTIYLKINMSRTEDLSNGEDTFVFFDDFGGDLSKWTVIFGTDFSIENGTLKAQQTSTTGLRDAIRTNTLIGKEAIVEYDIKPSSGTDIACAFWITGAANEPIWMALHNGANIYYWSGSEWTQKASGTSYRNADQWNKEKVIFTEAGEIKAYTNDNLAVSLTGQTAIDGYVGLRLGLDNIDYIDNFRVRKYADPEPTVSYEKA